MGSLTLFVVSVIIFSSLEMLPGGFAEAILGQGATPETVAAFNQELGLDRPATVRYVEWIGNVLHGDFGYSYAGLGGSIKRSVTDLIAPRLYNTFFLAIMTAIIAVPLSLFLGILAALYRNSWFDRTVNSVTLTTIATPEFFIAYLLMFFFAIKHRWFSSLSTVSRLDAVPRAHLPRGPSGPDADARHRRAHDAHDAGRDHQPAGQPLHRNGAAQGRSARARRSCKHALPNAWAPIATVIAFNLAYLVVGVVVVEVVFVYPGIGQLMVDSVSSRDMPVVQACALIFAATYILLNLSADIVSIVTNPRLLHPK